MTIAQIVYDNELHFGYSHEEIYEKVPYFSSCHRSFPIYQAFSSFPGGVGIVAIPPLSSKLSFVLCCALRHTASIIHSDRHFLAHANSSCAYGELWTTAYGQACPRQTRSSPAGWASAGVHPFSIAVSCEGTFSCMFSAVVHD